MKNAKVLNKPHSYLIFLESMKFEIFILHRTSKAMCVGVMSKSLNESYGPVLFHAKYSLF